MTDAVILARDGAIATITLNQPDRLNALDKGMWRRLHQLMHDVSADDDLRCIVLRGAGDQAFAAGAHVEECSTARRDRAQAREYGQLIHETLQAVGRCRHPTVALIRGACVDSGVEIAAMCDLRICGASSRFGVPFNNRLGVTMGYGELQGLLALVGRAATLEILLEGRVFGTDEALHMGLVNRVVADEAVEAEAYATAERIAAGAPLVARWHQEYVARLTPAVALTPEEWDEGYACFDTEDYRIGVQAFLEKKKPQFKGK